MNLKDAVEETRQLLRPTLPTSMETNVDLEPLEVAAWPVEIQQVRLTLCLNARDVKDGHGTIRIRTARSPARSKYDGQRCQSCAAALSGQLSR